MDIISDIITLRQGANKESLPVPTYSVAPSDSSSEIGGYLAIVGRHWKQLSALAILGCLVGMLATRLQSPVYRAQTSVELQSINVDFLNMKEARPVQENQQGTDMMTDLQTQIEILQSRVLAENTSHALLHARQEALEHRSTNKAQNRTGHGVLVRNLDEAMLEKIAKTVKVHSVGQTRIIKIQVDAPDSELAALFANTLITEYIKQNLLARSKMTESASEWTRSQVAEIRAKLAGSEQALQQYAAAHQLLFTAGSQSISDDRLRQVQSDLLRARADLAAKKARMNLSFTAPSPTLPDVLQDPSIQQLQGKLVDLQRQKAEMLIVYRSDYSEVQKVQSQIDELQAALTQERDQVVKRITNEYSQAADTERFLAVAYDRAAERATMDSQTAVQYDILKRDVDANLSAYQSVLSRVRELNLAAAIQTSNIRVIDTAKAPDSPHSPILAINVVLGFLTSTMVGIGAVLVLDRSNQSLRNPGDALSRVGVQELGVISSTTTSRMRFWALPFNSASESHAPLAEIAFGAEMMDDFRTLLASIMLSSNQANRPRVLVVTSCSPQDGKTTVAINLAVALARTGKRVLLVDGDLRRPRLHQVFRLPNERGLSNLLEEAKEGNDATRDIQSTSLSGLKVLTSGTRLAAPADLLFDSGLRSLLSGFAALYDMVIVDSPPMLRLPDARLLGSAAEAVILVARANRTSKYSVVTASQRLALDQTRLLGVVLNDWKSDGKPYYTTN